MPTRCHDQSRPVGQNTYKNKNFQGQLNLEYMFPAFRASWPKAMYKTTGSSVADNTIVQKSFSLYTYDQGAQTYKRTLSIRRLRAAPVLYQYQYAVQLSLNYKRQFAAP